MNPPALEFHNVTAAYEEKPVLYGVDLQIPAGSLCGLIGPNGAGKSSLLKCAMGLLGIDSGWVRFFGLPLEKARARVGYVPQREEVDWDFPVTVWDVVMMGRYGKLGWLRRPGREDRARVLSALEEVGLTEFKDRHISQLSGGQQQRVFLARALVQECDCYLMDEPFAGVDAATEQSIVQLLKRWRDLGKTILVVHHDLATAAEYYDRLVLLNLCVIAVGPTETVLTGELLQRTYGGKLTLLSDLGHQAQRRKEGHAEGV